MDGALSPESPALRAHIRMTQQVIHRMAEHSRSCKSWCVGFTAGTALLVALLEEPGRLWAIMLPIPFLTVMDAYYLAHERGVRRAHRRLLEKLQAETINMEDLYEPGTGQRVPRETLRALGSFSVYGFYGPMTAIAALLAALLG